MNNFYQYYRSRKTETSLEMNHGEIKAYTGENVYVLKFIKNVHPAAK